MGFMYPGLLYLLPISLLPLILHLIRGKKPEKVFLSWVFLVREEKLGRKKFNLERSLITLLRILFLLGTIIFISAPVPGKYNFSEIYIDTSLSLKGREKILLNKSKMVSRIYGERRIHYFSNALKREFHIGGKTDFSVIPSSGKVFVISDFQYTGFKKLTGINSALYMDTLLVHNSGFSKIFLYIFSKDLFLKIKNYNMLDSSKRIILKDANGTIYKDTIILIEYGSSRTFNFDLPDSGKRLNLFAELLPEDDFRYDNIIELTLPLETSISYSIIGKNRFVEKFCESAFGVKEETGSQLLVVIDKNVPLYSTNRVIVYFVKKPYPWLQAFGIEKMKDTTMFRYKGWEVRNAVLFKHGELSDDKGYGLIKPTMFDNKKIIFVGFIPSSRHSTLQYSPDFWALLFSEIMSGLDSAFFTTEYSSNAYKEFGKMLRNRGKLLLVLPDTVECNTKIAEEFINYFDGTHFVKVEKIYRDTLRLRRGVLFLVLIIFVLESFLTYHYLRKR